MEEISTELKLEINNLIWQYAPAYLSLYQAEDLAIKIGNMIMSGELNYIEE